MKAISAPLIKSGSVYIAANITTNSFKEKKADPLKSTFYSKNFSARNHPKIEDIISLRIFPAVPLGIVRAPSHFLLPAFPWISRFLQQTKGNHKYPPVLY